MIDFILNRIDLLLYVIVIVGIYTFIIYLWRKIAMLETSVYRLDKALTSIILENEKLKFENEEEKQDLTDTFNDDIEIIEDEVVSPIINTNNVNTNNVNTNNDDTNNVNTSNVDTNNIDDVVKELLEEEKKTYKKSELLKMTIDNIKNIASSLKISTDGNKADLINKILEK
tara:strand:+ start:18486 stop:18998 length:513 start_codon:yes stop_codon:yes gene_type:complete